MICRKCRDLVMTDNNFASGEDFEKLWTWAEEHEKLKPFLAQFSRDRICEGTTEDRAFFADALYRLLSASSQ